MTIRGALRRTHGQLPGSLELAYLGDTIYDLYVRAELVQAGGKIGNLHAQAVKRVNARAQSEALRRVEGMLTGLEADVVRRARNARQTPPKHADPLEYHRATALEALIGYLALTGQDARVREIVSMALELTQTDENG